MSLKERGVGVCKWSGALQPLTPKGTHISSWQKQQLYVIPAQLELELRGPSLNHLSQVASFLDLTVTHLGNK